MFSVIAVIIAFYRIWNQEIYDSIICNCSILIFLGANLDCILINRQNDSDDKFSLVC